MISFCKIVNAYHDSITLFTVDFLTYQVVVRCTTLGFVSIDVLINDFYAWCISPTEYFESAIDLFGGIILT